jgi:hypothetical protein
MADRRPAGDAIQRQLYGAADVPRHLIRCRVTGMGEQELYAAGEIGPE